MTYKIRYLAICILSLKVCNVRYILSYKHENMEFTPETQLNIAFYYRESTECSIMA